jgi:hypothetical protein
MAGGIKNAVLWDMRQCSLVDGYERFGGTYCLDLQAFLQNVGTKFCGITSHKTAT